MNEEPKFSLSYEQLLQETEVQIKKRNLSRASEFYVHERIMADNMLMFLHSLVLRGYQGISDTARIEADFQRLNAYIVNEDGVS